MGTVPDLLFDNEFVVFYRVLRLEFFLRDPYLSVVPKSHRELVH